MKLIDAKGERLSAIHPPVVSPLWSAEDVGRFGQKASNLARMRRLGLPVPPGFVIDDAAFQEFLDGNRLRRPVAALCEGLDPSDLDHVRRAAQTIRESILAAPVPPSLRRAIEAARIEWLPTATLIVRSSAIGEDSASASFAGQLDSFLHIESPEALERAVRACWASYWSDRSLCYQLTTGTRLDGMGVIVQEQIPSRTSGVLFTISPDGTDEMIAEYCHGHGDQLVGGRITPGRLTISRRDFAWRQHTAPEQPDGGEGERLFDHDRIPALARTGLLLEREFHHPQDIEWTIDGNGQLFLVQTRPITARAGGKNERSTIVWSNANVNENFPEPISPLLYSIASTGYYHYFRNLARAFGIPDRRLRAMEPVLRNLIGAHNARMYYNLTNIHAVLHLTPCGTLMATSFNHFVGASQTPAPPRRAGRGPGAGAGWFSRLLEWCRIGLSTGRQYLRLTRRVERFERTVADFSHRTRPEALAARPLMELHDDFRGFLDIRFHRWTDAALADAAAMTCYGVLKQLLNRAFPAADQAALHNTLLKGLPDVISSMPIVKLWELSRLVRAHPDLAELFATRESTEILTRLQEREAFAAFRSELDRFLEDWGFRCSGELMLTVPSFQENPAALLDILKTYVDLEGESPPDVQRRQDAERTAETARILRALSPHPLARFVPWPTRARLISLFLRWTQRAILLRERARLKQALLYSRARRIALAIGDRLVERGTLTGRNDIFFLTCSEIDRLLSGAEMFPQSINELTALRKREHARLSQMTPPDAFELAEGDYLAPTAGTFDRRHEPTDTETMMSGTGACGGRITARATLLTDVMESHRLTPGDILVTRQTDPGWGPVFFLIKGLVLERGGMLSHGAILAREYGIPTVVDVKRATRLIPDGATISVDGDRGHVQLHA